MFRQKKIKHRTTCTVATVTSSSLALTWGNCTTLFPTTLFLRKQEERMRATTTTSWRRDLLSHSDYFEEVNRYGYGKESTHC
ncbi:hypothetical protein MTO96_014919 [Rhipicephalus appendiculatus]